jgi:hypothetical protein
MKSSLWCGQLKKRTMAMKLFSVALVLMTFAVAGCNQTQTDDDAIRAAVRQHLVSLGTLNLQAMDMDFTKVDIQKGQASADVSFRPKTGAPTGPAMQVSYRLEKQQDGTWRVVKTAAAGGMIEHPNPNANPHGQNVSGSVHGNLPNFKDILGTDASSTRDAFPAGHPAVSSEQSGQKP